MQEWQAIESSRPGGALPNLEPIFERAASGDFTGLEQPLLNIIEILHKTLCSYHEEMGVLIQCIDENGWRPK